jgi:hypothetical protein
MVLNPAALLQDKSKFGKRRPSLFFGFYFFCQKLNGSNIKDEGEEIL